MLDRFGSDLFFRSGQGFSRYRSPKGVMPSIVIDPTKGAFAFDPTGSLQRYASPNGAQPSIIVDPTRGEYGGPL